MDPVVNHEEENQEVVEDRQVCSLCYCSELVRKYQEQEEGGNTEYCCSRMHF